MTHSARVTFHSRPYHVRSFDKTREQCASDCTKYTRTPGRCARTLHRWLALCRPTREAYNRLLRTQLAFHRRSGHPAQPVCVTSKRLCHRLTHPHIPDANCCVGCAGRNSSAITAHCTTPHIISAPVEMPNHATTVRVTHIQLLLRADHCSRAIIAHCNRASTHICKGRTNSRTAAADTMRLPSPLSATMYQGKYRQCDRSEAVYSQRPTNEHIHHLTRKQLATHCQRMQNNLLQLSGLAASCDMSILLCTSHTQSVLSKDAEASSLQSALTATWVK